MNKLSNNELLEEVKKMFNFLQNRMDFLECELNSFKIEINEEIVDINRRIDTVKHEMENLKKDINIIKHFQEIINCDLNTNINKSLSGFSTASLLGIPIKVNSYDKF